jgi:hypothetical protein
MDSVVRHHVKPTKKQLALLHMIYRFRFVTSELAARYQDVGTKTNMRRRLAILEEQGYISRKYESAYRLRGQHASYCLLPVGMKALKQRPDFEYDAKLLRNIYKDRDASDQFIEHHLTLMQAYCDLKEHYGDRLQFFTKSDLVKYTHFPQPLPDAYLSLVDGHSSKGFFLDVHQESRPFFVTVRRLKRYADYADSGAWEETGEELPKILALCDTATLQKRLQKRVSKTTHPEVNFLLSTKDALTRIADDVRVWQQPEAGRGEGLALEAA